MIVLASVLLPEPFGPIKAWISPWFTVRLTPLTISLPSMATWRSRTSSVGVRSVMEQRVLLVVGCRVCFARPLHDRRHGAAARLADQVVAARLPIHDAPDLRHRRVEQEGDRVLLVAADGVARQSGTAVRAGGVDQVHAVIAHLNTVQNALVGQRRDQRGGAFLQCLATHLAAVLLRQPLAEPREQRVEQRMAGAVVEIADLADQPLYQARVAVGRAGLRFISKPVDEIRPAGVLPHGSVLDQPFAGEDIEMAPHRGTSDAELLAKLGHGQLAVAAK